MPTLAGTASADLLDGTTAADRVRGLSDRDTVNGGGGDDTLSGGEGGDTLNGGAGDDLIYGFGASDRIAGTGDITATLITSSLARPVFASAAPGDPDRLYVVEKGGTIRVLDPATGAVAPFLAIPASDLLTSGEQGLLGLAFHPDHAANGRFFVFLVNAAGDIEVRQYQRSAINPDVADPDSGDVILTIPHPTYDNHNGGWIGFGPDGYLYVSTGDGGLGNDPANNAQNTGVLLGKILRIDVDADDFAADPGRDYAIPDDNPFAGTAAAGEIWALGLRNPWRPSFDRLTGDLYIADVGQAEREEINFQPADSGGGENYGWVIREGTVVRDPTRPGNLPPDSPLLVDPVIDYGHTDDGTGGFSVTGGYVYRGSGPGMQGVYLYADFVTNQIWSFRIVDGVAIDAANRTAQLVATGGTVDRIASFAEDGNGNLFALGIDGEVFLLTPGQGAGDGGDLIIAGQGNDTVHGGADNDTIRGGDGDDRLSGDGGGDRLDGGAGRDRLTGGTGADVFDFNSAGDSGNGTTGRDIITDFAASDDLLDLASVDAMAGIAGNQAFAFIGAARFSAEGQVRIVQKGDDVIVLVNTTGTLDADMSIRLQNVLATDMTADSFVL